MENGEAEARTYTEKEVIEFTVNILDGIRYPTFLMEMPMQQVAAIKHEIAEPIAAAKGNLFALLTEMKKMEANVPGGKQDSSFQDDELEEPEGETGGLII